MFTQAQPSALRQIPVSMPERGKRIYEFSTGNEPIRLEFPKPFGGVALTGNQANKWTINRSGWNYKLLIDSDQKLYAGEIKFGCNYRMAVLLDGKTYQLRCRSMWKNQWEWVDETGKSVMSFRSNMWSRRNRGCVYLYDSVPHQEYLLTLGWFMMVTYEDDASLMAAV